MMGQEPESLLNQVVADYLLLEALGIGASSWVYRARRAADPPRMSASAPAAFPDEAAIKLFHVSGASTRERADIRARFLAEAETLARLRHPHIVPIIASGEDPATGFTYMVLPYLSGGSLAGQLTGQPAMGLARVEAILTHIAAALDYAHTAVPGERPAIVHRDVKPANILLDGAGAPYLCDFGIARILSPTNSLHTGSGHLMGTPAYMSPEQFSDTRAVGPLTDIYSLGMVVYEMVAGRTAFRAPDWPALMRKHLDAQPTSPRNLRPDLPEPAAAVILKAIEKRPEDRFQNAKTFAAAFSEGLRGEWPASLSRPTIAPSPWPVAPTPSAASVAPAASVPSVPSMPSVPSVPSVALPAPITPPIAPTPPQLAASTGVPMAAAWPSVAPGASAPAGTQPTHPNPTPPLEEPRPAPQPETEAQTLIDPNPPAVFTAPPTSPRRSGYAPITQAWAFAPPRPATTSGRRWMMAAAIALIVVAVALAIALVAMTRGALGG